MLPQVQNYMNISFKVKAHVCSDVQFYTYCHLSLVSNQTDLWPRLQQGLSLHSTGGHCILFIYFVILGLFLYVRLRDECDLMKIPFIQQLVTRTTTLRFVTISVTFPVQSNYPIMAGKCKMLEGIALQTCNWLICCLFLINWTLCLIKSSVSTEMKVPKQLQRNDCSSLL